MSKLTEKLSRDQARKLVLLSQIIVPSPLKGKAIDATQLAIEQLGYIQIDTISVIERAHHHTIWNRNPSYEAAHLDQLVTEKKVFEYWSHAAAYLPMRDYRYTLPRKLALENGTIKHWHVPNKPLMQSILKRIEMEGPLMAKDFESDKSNTADWSIKPTKQALDCLFFEGDLMISSRKKFHKVYDLKERVLPEGMDVTMPTEEEYMRFLITNYLQANGIGKIEEMVYLLKKIKPLVSKMLKSMLLSGDILEVEVAQDKYYVLPASLELLGKRFDHNLLKILSPFDNLLIQRKRTKALFDFDYLLECYVPQAKRLYGYFSLPILWGDQLVARMDCKQDRKTGFLHLLHIALEPTLSDLISFTKALCEELKSFMIFNKSTKVKLHQVSPVIYYSVVEQEISEM